MTNLKSLLLPLSRGIKRQAKRVLYFSGGRMDYWFAAFIVLVVLKVFGAVAIHWVYVLLPLWLPVVLILSFGFLFAAFGVASGQK